MPKGWNYERTELRPWGNYIHCSPTWTAQLNLPPFPKLHSPEILTAQTYGFFQDTLDLTAQLKLESKLNVCVWGGLRAWFWVRFSAWSVCFWAVTMDSQLYVIIGRMYFWYIRFKVHCAHPHVLPASRFRTFMRFGTLEVILSTWFSQFNLYKCTMLYQSNTTRIYYVCYCIRATCFDADRIIFRSY